MFWGWQQFLKMSNKKATDVTRLLFCYSGISLISKHLCEYCTIIFVKYSVPTLPQSVYWLFANCCSQNYCKFRKSPNHTGLSFVCIFTFSVLGIESPLLNIEYLFGFVKIVSQSVGLSVGTLSKQKLNTSTLNNIH